MSTGSKIQPVRGTKDLLFKEAALFDYIISKANELFELYGYQPIYLPIFEFTDVFKRSLGDFSDVVSKEMYNLEDRGGESLTLRPEFTASIMRAMISNSLQHSLPLRLYTSGPLFRYERPQKGRQRQFHQINVECLGVSSPKIDAEMISMGFELIKKFGIDNQVVLNINSLGCKESRKRYVTALEEYFVKYENDLSEDSKIRLRKNPLRILDSKDENDKKISSSAPLISASYTKESADFFNEVLSTLDLMQIKYQINTNLVRGLDYYNHTTFEFITNSLGAQGTVLGGGRYNGLSSLMGGDDIPAIGFAAGVERLILLLTDHLNLEKRPNIIVPMGGEAEQNRAIILATKLRENNIMVIDEFDLNHSKKMKKVNKINAKYAIFIGENELKNENYTLKCLDSGIQEQLNLEQLIINLRK